ncbi:synthetase [Aureococcus anophagefferens]|nr:synthetase [Aureococcus anophagefferens]
MRYVLAALGAAAAAAMSAKTDRFAGRYALGKNLGPVNAKAGMRFDREDVGGDVRVVGGASSEVLGGANLASLLRDGFELARFLDAWEPHLPPAARAKGDWCVNLQAEASAVHAAVDMALRPSAARATCSPAILLEGAADFREASRTAFQSHTYAGSSARALANGANLLERLRARGQRRPLGPLRPRGRRRATAANLAFKKNAARSVLPYFVPVGGFMLTPRYDDEPELLAAAVADVAEAALETSDMGWAAAPAVGNFGRVCRYETSLNQREAEIAILATAYAYKAPGLWTIHVGEARALASERRRGASRRRPASRGSRERPSTTRRPTSSRRSGSATTPTRRPRPRWARRAWSSSRRRGYRGYVS